MAAAGLKFDQMGTSVAEAPPAPAPEDDTEMTPKLEPKRDVIWGFLVDERCAIMAWEEGFKQDPRLIPPRNERHRLAIDYLWDLVEWVDRNHFNPNKGT